MNDLIVIVVSLLFIGIAVIVYQYMQAIHAARKRLDSLGSQVIETVCGSIEYARVGKGYPVLVVHGAIGGFDQGLFLSRNVNLPNLQIISVSRFGYLRSPLTPGATLNAQADIYASLLDALGIRQAVVFAVSAGTTSAIRFAARHPQRISALILLGPDAPGETYMALPPRFVFDTLLRSDFFAWALNACFKKKMQISTGLIPKGYPISPQDAALVDKVQSSNLPTSRRMDGIIFETYAYEDEFKAFASPTSPFPLNQIQTQTLVINAADDPISIPENVRRLAVQMPHARQYVVPEGGHLFFGHADEVRAEIARFLRNAVPELNTTAE